MNVEAMGVHVAINASMYVAEGTPVVWQLISPEIVYSDSAHICIILGKILIFFVFFFSIGKTYALFTVKIYKADDPKQEVGSCTEVKFVYQSVNEDNIPLLIVYSYDPKIEHMNYKLLAERVLAENMLSTTAATSDTLPGVQAVPDSERRKRDDATMAPTATSPPIPGCRVNELTINAQDLRYLNPNKNPKGFNVIMPVTYNAGICGGKCDRSLPSNSGSDHALFIHLLLGTEGFKQQQKSHYSYTQCCVPISYKPLEVLYEDDVNNLSINIIKDMIIKECECLDVLDF